MISPKEFHRSDVMIMVKISTLTSFILSQCTTVQRQNKTIHLVRLHHMWFYGAATMLNSFHPQFPNVITQATSHFPPALNYRTPNEFILIAVWYYFNPQRGEKVLFLCPTEQASPSIIGTIKISCYERDTTCSLITATGYKV